MSAKNKRTETLTPERAAALRRRMDRLDRRLDKALGNPRPGGEAVRLSMDAPREMTAAQVDSVLDWQFGTAKPRRPIRLALIDDVMAHGIPDRGDGTAQAPAPIVLDLANVVFQFNGREISGSELAEKLGLVGEGEGEEADTGSEPESDRLAEEVQEEPAQLSLDDSAIGRLLDWQCGPRRGA